MEDTVLARVVVERNLVTSGEIRVAQDYQKDKAGEGHARALGDILVDLGFMTRTQLGRVMGASEDSGGRPAQQFAGYQVQRKVGAGAMAVVYRAKQLSLDRTVAIKILPRRLSKNADFVERFYREGRAAAALNHNNIVQAIDVGESGGLHYFVMEFVEGCTVYDELAEGKVYNEREAIHIVAQIGEALLHAHERGFIHRDVKPKNIMLTKERVAKLADMGLAREASDLEAAMAEAGRAYGTPYYISPEQVRGEVNIDHRADIYSLGATFYHMVTGRVPFDAPNPSAVMHKHLREDLTPPDHINMKLTSGCGAMIEMMMAKDADDRYASCRELLEDLRLLNTGAAPRYASQRIDEDSLESLAAGDAVQHAPRAADGAMNPLLIMVIVLGSLLAIALVIILVLVVS